MKKNYAFMFAAAFALAAGYVSIQPSQVKAAAGQTALGKCVDSVVAACNKKSDAARNPCIDSGISQCEKQHKAKIELPNTPRYQPTTYRVQPNR